MKKPTTPFPLTGYYGPDYFCDRDDETKILSGNIHNGISTVLTAQRRIGKTSLIMHVLSKQPSRIRTIYVDILPTENRNDFLNALATALVRNIADKKGFGRKIWDFIRSLRPVLSFDDLSGSPQVSFAPGSQDVNARIEAILNFLEKGNDKFVLAIDEFQQILNYPELNTDAWLRTVIHRMKNLVFIFSGSQQHLMNELFTIPSRPFYNSASMMKIGRIKTEAYSDFISKKFFEAGKVIGDDVILNILKWADGHTYYVQLLCSRTFLSGLTEITDVAWKEEASRLILENESVFFIYRSMLTNPQWQLLKAIGREGEVFEPTSSEFMIKNNLGASATVLRSLHALLKMELIYYDFTPEGRKYHKMNDLLFRRWVDNLD